MRMSLLSGAILIVAVGCVSKTEYDHQVQQLTAISAEKDSLLQEVVQTSQFIAEVNGELDKVKSGAPVTAAGAEMESLSPTQQRQALAERVKGLTERLRESETRLAQSRRRVSQLAATNATMQAQMASFDSTIKSFQILIDNQKGEIVSLLEQVSVLTAENTALKDTNTQLKTERAALSAEKASLTTEQNTVFWIAGRKDDLLRRGVIEQRGGMLGIGKTQVMARRLDESAFTAIDRTQVQEFTLPNPARAYRIISPNDLSGLDAAPADGRFRGAIRVAMPEKFWRPSKFLVLMEL